MKLLSFTTEDSRRGVGVLTDDGVRMLRSITADEAELSISPMRTLLLQYGSDLSALHSDVSHSELFALADIRLDAPVPDPGKIIAAPVNYRDHQEEMNQDAHIDALGVFLKAPSSLVPHGSTVRLPYTDRRFDQEGELALVIGKRASNVAAKDALSCVAGYTLLLDITMRGGEDRSTRKSFDTFTPMGPFLVTPDEVGDLKQLNLLCSVSGTLRQDASIADLIWGVPELIAYASSVMTLNPGDVISTGTPAGVGQIHDGQHVAVEIEGIGRLEVSVSAQGSIACPTRGAGRGPKPPEALTPLRPAELRGATPHDFSAPRPNG